MKWIKNLFRSPSDFEDIFTDFSEEDIRNWSTDYLINLLESKGHMIKPNQGNKIVIEILKRLNERNKD